MGVTRASRLPPLPQEHRGFRPSRASRLKPLLQEHTARRGFTCRRIVVGAHPVRDRSIWGGLALRSPTGWAPTSHGRRPSRAWGAMIGSSSHRGARSSAIPLRQEGTGASRLSHLPRKDIPKRIRAGERPFARLDPPAIVQQHRGLARSGERFLGRWSSRVFRGYA
jgi:hypothetical protein